MDVDSRTLKGQPPADVLEKKKKKKLSDMKNQQHANILDIFQFNGHQTL